MKKYKTVIFIDGCFWHGHENCKYFRLPKTNVHFWRHKIAMNFARDYANNVDLKLDGWRVIRIWECEIRTKAKREETLSKLYAQITIGTQNDVTLYGDGNQPDIVAAEPETPYVR